MLTKQDKGRPLPKFGEWDVNNPASAEGFTVIFSKARDEKKSSNGNAAGAGANTRKNDNNSSKPADPNYYEDPAMVTFTNIFVIISNEVLASWFALLLLGEFVFMLGCFLLFLVAEEMVLLFLNPSII